MLYRIDVFGPYRLRLVESLLERLPYEPWSLCRAKELGDTKWFGYSWDSERLNALLDGQALQTKATSQRKVTLRDSEKAPRPESHKAGGVVLSSDSSAVAAVLAAIG